MSIIHLNQMKRRIETDIAPYVDMSDQKQGSQTFNDILLSRGLAAYSVYHLAGCDPKEAATSIGDGGDDNGIDAIYLDESESKLYLVQSKWIHDGRGEPDNASVKKFISGIHDLLSLNFDRFNKKIIARQDEISNALSNAGL